MDPLTSWAGDSPPGYEDTSAADDPEVTYYPPKYPDNNPKSVYGVQKPPMHLNPPTALVLMSEVFKLGAEKYGPYNWREKSVSANVYVAAALRHIHSYYDGEDQDSESGVSHLAHAMACMAIILDATVTGNLIDDRPTPGKTAALIEHLRSDT
jgi:hypothetical protein